MLIRTLAAGSLFVIVAFGCSSSSSNVTTTTDAGTDDAASASDTGASDAGDLGDAGGGSQSGFVYAISDSTSADGGTKSEYRAGASFVRTTEPDTRVSRTVGPCEVEKYDDQSPPEQDVSAGIVHIQGGSANLDLAPKADGTYDQLTAASLLYAGGESLTVKADGAGVPAFTTTLTAPSKITLSAPVPTMGTIDVTKSAGVSATFTGASSGKVVLYFSTTDAMAAYSVRCKFPASAGTAKIPAEAFQDFPTGDGFFDFYVEERSDVAPSGWQIHFTATKAVVDASGTALQGAATFK